MVGTWEGDGSAVEVTCREKRGMELEPRGMEQRAFRKALI